MVDITKCQGTECPLKIECYRYRAPKDSVYQAYFTEVLYDKEKGTCDSILRRSIMIEKREYHD